MRAERVQRISVNDFVAHYIRKNRPVVVTDAMDSWEARRRWTPAYFQREYGDRLVPVYGTYFDFFGTIRLDEYISKYMGSEAPSSNVPYARWFTLHQALSNSTAKRFPWADEVFRSLRHQWSHPYFLPTSSYLFPFCSTDQSLDVPSDTTVPSKALYLSGRGAVTNLHIDYWGSDAVLCQVYGQKEMTLYPPDQADFLMKMNTSTGAVRGTSGGRQFVDIKKPDLKAFPEFPQAKPSVQDVLDPGEIVFVPAGWFHHVDTVSHSITLTWNFVHIASWRSWFKFLMNDPPQGELRDIEYLLFDDPKRLL